MIYVSQIIMLYMLNMYSVVCQLYLNKTGRKIVISSILPRFLFILSFPIMLEFLSVKIAFHIMDYIQILIWIKILTTMSISGGCVIHMKTYYFGLALSATVLIQNQ